MISGKQNLVVGQAILCPECEAASGPSAESNIKSAIDTDLVVSLENNGLSLTFAMAKISSRSTEQFES